MPNTERYQQELRNQLQFLRVSAREFDDGFHKEAVRIASVLRTIFHTTNHSRGLINFLGARHIKLLTRIPVYPQEFVSKTTWYMPGLLDTSKGYLPDLGQGPYSNYVPVDEWWNQTVHMMHKRGFSRSQIVRWAANKDGGAHVDPDLPQEYIKLMNNMTVVTRDNSTGKQVDAQPSKDPFVILRQAADEALNSEELIGLTR